MKKRYCIVFAAALAGMALILIAFYHAYADRETSMRRWGQQMADLTGTADMSSRSLAYAARRRSTRNHGFRGRGPSF